MKSVQNTILLFSLLFVSTKFCYGDNGVYPGEFRILINNNLQNKTIHIIVHSVSIVWDSAYNITSNYAGGSFTTNNTFDIYSFDHVYDLVHRQTGRFIGYGKYQIQIFSDDALRYTFYADFTDCLYNVGYGKADIEFEYYSHGDSLYENSPTSTQYRIYNEHTTHIWDQNTIPIGSPSVHKFQPTTPSNLQVVNASGHPQLQWVGSEPAVSKYNVYRNNIKITNTPISSTTYIDYDVAFGSSMQQTYKVQAVSGDGTKTSAGYSNAVTINAAPARKEIPVVKISQLLNSKNYPNPFNPHTTIRYELAEESFVSVKVFDALGRESKKLVNEYQTVGIKSVRFNAETLPSGVYYYMVTTGNKSETKTMILMK